MNSVEYEEWIKKFEAKKTTDDCYTPADAYNNAVKLFEDITGIDTKQHRIVRPFYPGGDYENFEYKDGDIVIDNPPFSIITKIRKFYDEKGIRYFLFAPLLTIFGTCAKGYVLVYKSVEYLNGAKVATGFISNTFDGIYTKDTIQGPINKGREKMQLPPDVYNAAQMRKFAKDPDMHYYKIEGDIIKKAPDGRRIYGCAYKVRKVR